MPPVVAASAIAAGGAIAGGVLSNRANKNASQSQAQSTQAALDYEKQKDAEERAYRDRQDAAAKAQYDAQEALRAPYRQASAGLLGSEMARLGFSLPSSSLSAPPLIANRPRTLADLAGTGTQIAPPIDDTTSDPYNTRYATPATGRKVTIPQLSLKDIMEGMQQGSIG